MNEYKIVPNFLDNITEETILPVAGNYAGDEWDWLVIHAPDLTASGSYMFLRNLVHNSNTAVSAFDVTDGTYGLSETNSCMTRNYNIAGFPSETGMFKSGAFNAPASMGICLVRKSRGGKNKYKRIKKIPVFQSATSSASSEVYSLMDGDFGGVSKIFVPGRNGQWVGTITVMGSLNGEDWHQLRVTDVYFPTSSNTTINDDRNHVIYTTGLAYIRFDLTITSGTYDISYAFME